MHRGDGRQDAFLRKGRCKRSRVSDTNAAITKHCHGVANRYPILDSLGRKQQAAFVDEGNVYRLIASSKLPTAQRFESWVFDEVLPSIRRRGGYMVSDQQETPEQTMARALLIAKDAIARKDKIIEQQQPKALFADAVAASDGTCLVGELAKILKQNGVNVGQNRLFSMLRNDGFLGTSGSNYNVPTQKAMDLKLFRIKETSIQHSDGHVTINRTPKVTGKGQLYFVNKYTL